MKPEAFLKACLECISSVYSSSIAADADLPHDSHGHGHQQMTTGGRHDDGGKGCQELEMLTMMAEEEKVD